MVEMDKHVDIGVFSKMISFILDFCEVLRLEPGNKQASTELIKIDKVSFCFGV